MMTNTAALKTLIPWFAIYFLSAANAVDGYEQLKPHQTRRRSLFVGSASAAATLVLGSGQKDTWSAAAASTPPSLAFSDSKSGISWADAKIGTGSALEANSMASIDYVLSTTGARYGSKIYSSADQGVPYRWKLGDGSTIAGLEQAILGNDDIPAMRPGGIRRLIIPPNLAYQSLASSSCEGGVGPIPPKLDTDSFEAFQRFKNIYCNSNRAYQPNIVMDVKLYGKRTVD